MDDVDDSDNNADFSQKVTESDADWELNYVSSHDISIDSNEPLSVVALRLVNRKAPGTPGFVWKKRRFMRCLPFLAVPGVKDNHLDADSTAREILNCFLTPDL